MAPVIDYHPETIDLVSSDDESDSSELEQEAREELDDVDMPDYDAASPPPAQVAPQNPLQPLRWESQIGGSIVVVDGEEVFIPDEIELAGPASLDQTPPETSRDEELARALSNEYGADQCDYHDVSTIDPPAEVTVDSCLQRILAIFPNVSHNYVTGLYNGFDGDNGHEALPGEARLDNIIEQLISNPSYPKQEKGKKALKRKRQDSTDDTDLKQWERDDRVIQAGWPRHQVQGILKAEFPDIPISYINGMLAIHKHLYQTYLVLHRSQEDSSRRYGKGRASSKVEGNADTIAVNSHWPPLIEELEAARMKVQLLRSEKEAEEATKRKEKENLERAIARGETAECTACFDDLPMNRQIHCDGDIAHFICYDCALIYIKSEVGESRCRVLCTAGCGAGFAGTQLALLSDEQLLEKLAQLQQDKDIRDAGLEDLEECPFCDYKAILPPIEEDFEFHCPNPECEKVSCRRCKSVSHTPLSCEEYAKDNKVNSRHKIEEAMSAALLRKCNKCSRAFIKEYGCNKMTCTSCGNTQCYVCSTSVTDYNHFDQNAPGGRAGAAAAPRPNSRLCPLYDNVEERHEREVKEAEAAARAQVVEDNPDLTEEDLEIKVSNVVKTAEAGRARAANARDPMENLGIPGGYGFFGGLADGHEVFEAIRAAGPPPAFPRHLRRFRAGRDRGHMEPAPERVEPNWWPGRVPAQPAAPEQAAAPPAAPPAVQMPIQGHVQGYIPVIGFPQADRQGMRHGDAPRHALPPALGGYLFGNQPQPPPYEAHNFNQDLDDFENLFGMRRDQHGVNNPPAANQIFGGINNGPFENLFIPHRPNTQQEQQQQQQPPAPLQQLLAQPAQQREQDRAQQHLEPTPAQQQHYRNLEQMRQQHNEHLLHRHHRDQELRRLRSERHSRMQEQARMADLAALQRQVREGREQREREGRNDLF